MKPKFKNEQLINDNNKPFHAKLVLVESLLKPRSTEKEEWAVEFISK